MTAISSEKWAEHNAAIAEGRECPHCGDSGPAEASMPVADVVSKQFTVRIDDIVLGPYLSPAPGMETVIRLPSGATLTVRG